MTRNDSRFVLAPTSVDSPGRSNELSCERASFQHSQCSEDVLRLLRQAVKSGRVDASVFGAAMQRCGQSRWWDALLEVIAIMRNAKTTVNPIVQSICLTALARSVRAEHGFGAVVSRQKAVLGIAKAMWQRSASASGIDIIGMNAAFAVCIAARSKAAFQWAEELWSMAQGADCQLGALSFETFAQVLETYGFSDRVDDMLRLSRKSGWSPDYVCLGALVNIAGEKYNLTRAKQLWVRFVRDFGVKPHAMAYSSYAKAHILSGHPGAAASILEKMPKRIKRDSKHGGDLVQSLLIVYHSSLSRRDRLRLDRAFCDYQPYMKDASKREKSVWKKIRSIAESIRSSPRKLKFHDMLLDWTTQRSKMSDWPDHEAGSKDLSGEK